MKKFILAASMIPMMYGMAQTSDEQIQEIKITAENHQVGAKSPAGYPKIHKPVGLKFEAGGLYQNAIIGGVHYAYSVKTDELFNPVGTYEIEHYYPKAKMSWGATGSVSYYCEKQGYEIKLKDSYYSLSTSSSVDSEGEYYIFPCRTHFDPDMEQDYFQYADSKIDFTYNLLGLDLQKSFYVNRYFSIDAIGGVLASWLWTTNKNNYQGLNFDELGADDEAFVYHKHHYKWFGIGPEVGANFNFMLTRGFSVFINNIVALMYGKLEANLSEEEFLGGDIEEDLLQIKTKNHDHRLLPYTQIFMGLSYEFFMHKREDFLKLRAGYNTQFFLNFNSHGDNQVIQTQGLAFDLAWAF